MTGPAYGSVQAAGEQQPLEVVKHSWTRCLRTILTWPARISFVCTFSLLTLPVWAYTAITDACCCGCDRTSAPARQRRGRFIGWLVSVFWRLAFRLCWWIRVETEDLEPLHHAGRSGRQVFIAVNHASWLDTPIICARLPVHLVGDTKTLMSGNHLGLPVLGRLALAIGHLPVPFTSRESGKFGVDKERLARTKSQMRDHLGAGGHLAIFPEGDLNGDWRTLLPFRAGGLEFCIRHDMEVWSWVMAGTAECWPQNALLGGFPAVIRNRAALVYPSARDAAQELAGADADLRTLAIALASDLQGKMQRSLDELLATSSDAA